MVVNKLIVNALLSDEEDTEQEKAKNSAAMNTIGYINDSFKEYMQLFLDQSVLEGAACKQKYYMQSHLKNLRRLEIKVVVRRLKKMLYKISCVGVINSKSLDNYEVMDILARTRQQA